MDLDLNLAVIVLEERKIWAQDGGKAGVEDEA